MESSGKVTARWEVMLSKREVVEAVARAAMKKRGLMVPSQFKVEAYYEDGRVAFGEETWVEMFDGYTAIVLHTERIVRRAHVNEVFSNEEERAPELVLGDIARIVFTEAGDESLALKRVRKILGDPEQSEAV